MTCQTAHQSPSSPKNLFGNCEVPGPRRVVEPAPEGSRSRGQGAKKTKRKTGTKERLGHEIGWAVLEQALKDRNAEMAEAPGKGGNAAGGSEGGGGGTAAPAKDPAPAAESSSKDSAPADSGSTKDPGAGGSPDKAAGEENKTAEDPGKPADPGTGGDQGQKTAKGDQQSGTNQQTPAEDKAAEKTADPGAGKNGKTGNQDTAGDEFGDRVRAEAPLPDSDTGSLRDAARDLRTTGTRGQEAVDEALHVRRDTGQNFGGQPGEQLGTKLAAQAEDTKKTGEHMNKLADDVEHAADTIDATKQERLNDIEDGRPTYELAGATLPAEEGARTQDRMVADTVNRAQGVTQQGAQAMGGIGDWFSRDVEQEQTKTADRIDIATKLPDSEDKLPAYRRPGDETTQQGREKILGGWGIGRKDGATGPALAGKGERNSAFKSKNYLDPAVAGNSSVVRNYDGVADAAGKVDTGLHNLEIAGKDVPVQFAGSASGWVSTGSPADSLYTEGGSTATEKGLRYDGKAAWGAGGTAGGRLDIGAVTASGGAEAMAGGELKGRLDIGGKYLGAEVGGFAGGRAGVSGAADIGGVGAGGKAEVRAGLGFEAGLSAGVKDGKWVLGGKLGATLGVGGKVEGQIVIDPAEVGKTLTDAGGALGDWVGGLFPHQQPAPSLPAGAV
jgi:hypothetical protein